MNEVYTVEKHVKSLVALLARDEPCQLCPAASKMDMKLSPCDMWDCESDFPCRVCRQFVGLSWNEDAGRWWGDHPGCPCNAIGNSEAIRRTFEALKAYQREMML